MRFRGCPEGPSVCKVGFSSVIPGAIQMSISFKLHVSVCLRFSSANKYHCYGKGAHHGLWMLNGGRVGARGARWRKEEEEEEEEKEKEEEEEEEEEQQQQPEQQELCLGRGYTALVL
jgi:hypothetical protein